ncbi:lamin tail domain-containing protein [Halomicrococcus gelatinilyticus]|uniref:lamin tail domain-containing protein n=1 Tax=Halomicrococcus gelatinilyticus TaxID=1702103 RepID=UPI002E0FBC76
MRRRTLGVVAVVVLVVLAGCTGGVFDPSEETTGTIDGGPTADGSSVPVANGTLSVYHLNVGQGASTLTVGPTGETMLVDTGDWSDDGTFVIDQLQTLGIERIDHLVTTHPDADHIGGHADVIEYLETQGDGVGAVWDPGITSSSQTYESYLDAIEEHDVTLYETRAGDEIPLEGVATRVLAPPDGYIANGDSNENSIVLRLQHGNASFLLPGDGEAESEQYLRNEYGGRLDSTVLAVGHHGSISSSTAPFLDTVTPQIALISSGYDSQYGHPHDEVLARLSERSIRTYWTATHGTIRLESNGTAITVATQAAAPTDPVSLRDGEPIAPGTSSSPQVRTVVPVDGTTSAPAIADGGTTTAAASGTGELSVATVHADADGRDGENLTDEYIVLENTGSEALDLSGWTVADEAGHTYTFPVGFVLDAGAQVTLHTGSGADSATDRYWGAGSPVWNNAGDTIIVEGAEGNVVLEDSYDG